MPRLRLSPLALAALWVCSSPPVRAGEAPVDLAAMTLENLLEVEVQGDSKFELRGAPAASSASVISADDIRAHGWRTLAEALQSLPGVAISSDRSYARIAVRGARAPGPFNNRVLLLIDGIRINDTVADQAPLGSDFPLDLDLVERIEFIPGQGSAVHGANALFGVINVITRSAAGGSGWQLASRADDTGYKDARATHAGTLGAQGRLLLSATLRRDAGGGVDYAAGAARGSAAGAAQDHGSQWFAKYQQGEVSATLLHAQRDKRYLGDGWIRLGDPANRYRDSTTLAEIDARRPLGSRELWKTRLYAGGHEHEAVEQISARGIGLYHHRRARWWGFESTLSSTRCAQHELGIGFDLRRSPRRDQITSIYGIGEFPPLVDQRHDGRDYALFVEDRWTPLPALTLDAGLRWDRDDASRGGLSPRLALTWRAREDLRTTWTWGSAFRRASNYETWFGSDSSGFYQLPNPDLQGERLRGSELAAEWRPAPQRRLLASVYAIDSDDMIANDPDPASGRATYRNGLTMRLRGAELAWEQGAATGAQWRASLGAHRVAQHQAGQPHDENTLKLAKLAAVLPLRGGRTLALQAVRAGALGRDAPAATRIDATLSQAWQPPRVRIGLSVWNLLDRRSAPYDEMLGGSTRSRRDGRRIGLALEASL